MDQKTASKIINPNSIHIHAINITDFLGHLNHQMTMAYTQKISPVGIPRAPFSTPSEHHAPASPLGNSHSLDDE